MTGIIADEALIAVAIVPRMSESVACGSVNTFRIALANLRFPASPQESVALAEKAIAQAGSEHAGIICFPECFVPGYRSAGRAASPPDAAFLERAWSQIAAAAARASVAVVLGTERIEECALRASALVINSDGSLAGFQDKVQLDPSEEGVYAPGRGRQLFHAGPLKFGIAICHEGWRYPETVRWAAQRGAHIVFHPHFHEAEPGGYAPTTFADPRNTFHEKAVLCRAAENTCYVATVNFASAGSPTTSAVAQPDGTLLCYQPYGNEGLLTADLDLSEATGLLARRYRAV
jgi:predicted amidohydrolase